MKIELIERCGYSSALLGLGLSYGITSGKTLSEVFDFPFDEGGNDIREKLEKIAVKLCTRGFGEDKFLRQMVYIWDVQAPRFWWSEADTYKLSTVAQSESTMHTIMHRHLTVDDFEDGDILNTTLEYLNNLIDSYRTTKSNEIFFRLKKALPEGFLQRRIWSMNLANMKNIYRQRKNHRLPQWKIVCDAFYNETYDFLRGMYNIKEN